MNGPQIFAQLTKVDEEKRLVYGRAAHQVPDNAGEMFDYASSKPHFEAWSDGIKKDSGGANLGNIRAMHGTIAAGKVTEMDFNDIDAAIDIVGKIVDDNEWKKVLEGVYTGFSIGGKYAPGSKQVVKVDGKDVTRYTAIPVEVSLVDRPCIPSCTFFEVQKSDGTLAKVDFKPERIKVRIDGEDTEFQLLPEDAVVGKTVTVTYGDDESTELYVDKLEDGVAHTYRVSADGQVERSVPGNAEDVLKLGQVMEDHKLTVGDVLKFTLEAVSVPEFGDAVNKRYPLDTPESIREAWEQLNKVEHFRRYSPSELNQIRSAVAEAWMAKGDPDTAEPLAGKTGYAVFMKGMYQVQVLADIVDRLNRLSQMCDAEEANEGDGASDMPVKMRAVMKSMTQLLRDLVLEETTELEQGEGESDAQSPQPSLFNLFDNPEELKKVIDGTLAKRGARNSATDLERIQRIHDMATELGSQCGGSNADGSKSEAVGDLAKLAGRLETLEKSYSDAMAKLQALSAQPAPTRVALRAISKANDTVELEDQTPVAPVLKGDAVDEVATAIKKVHQTGGRQILI